MNLLSLMNVCIRICSSPCQKTEIRGDGKKDSQVLFLGLERLGVKCHR